MLAASLTPTPVADTHRYIVTVRRPPGARKGLSDRRPRGSPWRS